MSLGLLGVKVGMTQIYDQATGEAFPVTVLQVGPCPVLQIRDSGRDGYDAVQLGFRDKARRKATRAERGHVSNDLVSKRREQRRDNPHRLPPPPKADCEPQRFVREFRLCGPLSEIEVGKLLTVSDVLKVLELEETAEVEGEMEWNVPAAATVREATLSAAVDDGKELQVFFNFKDEKRVVEGDWKKTAAEARATIPANAKVSFGVRTKEKLNVKVRLIVTVARVDVTGTSKGRGFSGVIKRWNMGGLKASHGAKKVHRSGGSTSSRAGDLGGGRPKKGGKAAGQYGNTRVTVSNLQLVQIDEENHLAIVRGAVPGPNGGYVILRPTGRS